MNNIEFVEKLKDVEANFKTLYVMGCFGAPMTASNKQRYCSNHSYNRKTVRTKMIQQASTDTFGFDCVCLIKGVLWGWKGLKDKPYGGAIYGSNNVPDISADQMIAKCSNISTNFSKIEIGEAVWMRGHIGVYIGNGLAIECTPKWKNRVQITSCNCTKQGYKRRNWTKHGKLPYIEYIDEKPNVESENEHVFDHYTLKEFIKDVQKACGAEIDGKAGPETLSKTVTVSATKNRKHAVVKPIQKRLYALGYTEVGDADGVAGPKFTAAVKHFQKDHGRTVDGEITAKQISWKKLLGMA